MVPDVDANGDVVYIHYIMTSADIVRAAGELLDTCICHKTRMAARVITRVYDDALRSTGLRATQLSVLAAVGAHGALSIKALADTLEMERTTLTRNLRPLEEQGFVALSAEGRHRSRTLTLTASGRAALRGALPAWEKAQRSVERDLAVPGEPAIQTALLRLTRKAKATTL